jgi:hypothetical protein
LAKTWSGKAVLKLDDSTGTPRDISGDITNVESPYSLDSFEVSGFGDTTKSYVTGLADASMAISGKVNTAANRSHAVFTSLLGGTVGYTLTFMPLGTAVGLPKFFGEVFVSSYNLTADLGGALSYKADVKPADSTGMAWSTN